MPKSRGSIGLRPAGTSSSDGGGVVIKTPARNSAARNPGGTGGTGVTKLATTRNTPGGRNVIGTKGRTISGTNKTIA